MSFRDAADRSRTVMECLAADADRETPTGNVPLERPSQNGAYEGRCEVRVIPAGVTSDRDAMTLIFGRGARASSRRGAGSRGRQLRKGNGGGVNGSAPSSLHSTGPVTEKSSALDQS